MKENITKLMLFVITIIVIFSIIGGLGTTVRDGARAATEANNCTADSSLTYNRSAGFCMNSTGNNQYAATVYNTLPLLSLFNESGVITLVLMAAILIGIIAYALRRKGT